MNVKNTAFAMALIAAFAAPAFAADQTPVSPASSTEAASPAKAPETKKEMKKHHGRKKAKAGDEATK